MEVGILKKLDKGQNIAKRPLAVYTPIHQTISERNVTEIMLLPVLTLFVDLNVSDAVSTKSLVSKIDQSLNYDKIKKRYSKMNDRKPTFNHSVNSVAINFIEKRIKNDPTTKRYTVRAPKVANLNISQDHNKTAKDQSTKVKKEDNKKKLESEKPSIEMKAKNARSIARIERQSSNPPLHSNGALDRVKSCRTSLQEINQTFMQDKLKKIHDTFNKFMKENDRIKSSHSLIRINEVKSTLDSNKTAQIAMGMGILQTIVKMRVKAEKRHFLSSIV